MSYLQLLSDEWRDEVRSIVAELAGAGVDEVGFIVNATITDVPFGTGTLELHSLTGPMVGWEDGHIDTASVTIRADYQSARALVLAEDWDVLEQELAAGVIRIEGDSESFREWWSSRVGNAVVLELERRVRAITA